MDSRKKACPNERCEYYKSKKYNCKMNYCPYCGKELVFVCKSPSCYKPIEDIGPKHLFCEECLAKQNDAKDAVLKGVKNLGAAAGAVVMAAGKKEVREVVKKGLDTAIKVIKK